MKFQVDGVRSGTNQAVRMELEGADMQTVIRKAVSMGLVRVKVKAMSEAAPANAAGAAGTGYGGDAAYSGHEYSNVDIGTKFPASVATVEARKKLWIRLGLVAALVVMLVVAALILWPAKTGAAGVGRVGMAKGATLDPRLYMPAATEKEAVVSVSINGPRVLALGAAKKLRSAWKIDEIAMGRLAVSLDDVQELLLVGIGPAGMKSPPTEFIIFILNKDLDVPDMFKSRAMVSDPQAVEGYYVYESLAGPGTPRPTAQMPRPCMVKLAPATYLICDCRAAELAVYLKRLGSGAKVEFSPVVKTAWGEVKAADVAAVVDFGKATDAGMPLAVAASMTVEPAEARGEMAILMKDKSAAQIEYDDYLKLRKKDFEAAVPGIKVTQKGAFVRMEAKMSSADIEKNFSGGPGGLFGVGP